MIDEQEDHGVIDEAKPLLRDIPTRYFDFRDDDEEI
jgi:hypothetical protein